MQEFCIVVRICVASWAYIYNFHGLLAFTYSNLCKPFCLLCPISCSFRLSVCRRCSAMCYDILAFHPSMVHLYRCCTRSTVPVLCLTQPILPANVWGLELSLYVYIKWKHTCSGNEFEVPMKVCWVGWMFVLRVFLSRWRMLGLTGLRLEIGYDLLYLPEKKVQHLGLNPFTH